MNEIHEIHKKIEEKLNAGEAYVWESGSPEDTFALGELLGGACSAGQVYGLDGDLGAGKTVFAQGFAKGIGIAGSVNSPTFTILQVYEEGRLPFYHFDVYRLGGAEEMEEIGWEDCFYGEGVCLVEWADSIEELLPEDALRVTIGREPEKGFDCRRIVLWRKGAERKAGKNEDTGTGQLGAGGQRGGGGGGRAGSGIYHKS